MKKSELIEWYSAGYIGRSELADRLIDLASEVEAKVIFESLPDGVMEEVKTRIRDCPVNPREIMFVHGFVARGLESEADRAARLEQCQLAYWEGAERLKAYLAQAQQTAVRDRAKSAAREQ